MKITRTLAICGCCVFAAGCAGFGEPPERPPQADGIAVYEQQPPGSRPWRLVKRVWVEPWRSAFNVPAYESAAQGAADLQVRAVALGGDAVMNFGCYRLDAGIAAESRPVLVCNGSVIKYVQ